MKTMNQERTADILELIPEDNQNQKSIRTAIRENSLYDLTPVTELFVYFDKPENCSKILREIHHKYASLLLEDFMESDLLEKGKEVNYTNETLTELFFLKILADHFDKINISHA
jgi:hypothetical protein